MGQDVDYAFASLAPALRSSRRDTLIRLATMTGGLAQDGLVVTTSRRAVLDLSSEVRASVISTGAEFLRTWPHGFKSWIDERSEELRTNREQLMRFRARLQRLVKANLESGDLVDLVLDSMPELREHAVHAFAKRRHYLYVATRTSLRLDNAQMKALRQWIGEGYRPSPTTAQFQKGQFDADVIDALSPVFNSAVPFTACSWHLKIPHYAVEQCCRPGLLTRETHPAFLAVKKARSVQSGSLDALVKNLINKQSLCQKQKGTTSLSVAVKRIGGRLKPWASIIQALADGKIKFWIDQDETTSKSIHLHATEIAQFDRLVDDPDVTKITSTDTISQIDAADILNIKPALVSKLGIVFIPVGRAFVAPVREILKVAESVAWETEVSWHLGVHHRKVEDVLTSLGIERLLTGWSRSQLIAAGILPKIDNCYLIST